MPKKAPHETPLYVRLPTEASDRLERAATALGIRKKDLIANLVTTYVDPDSKQGLSALGTVCKDSGAGRVQPFEQVRARRAARVGREEWRDARRA